MQRVSRRGLLIAGSLGVRLLVAVGVLLFALWQDLASRAERSGDTLEAAILSAMSDVERAGHRVARVELERQCRPAD